jgi:hypothetical protein
MNLEERFMTFEAESRREPGFFAPRSEEELAGRQERLTQTAVTAADTMAGAAKGLVTGFAGLPGDVLAIGRGLFELGRRGADETKADAFLRGLEEGAILPTSEDISKWLDKTVGPVVPEGQQTGVPTEMRTEAAERGQLGGEIAAPAGYVKAAKRVTQGVKRMKKSAAGGAGVAAQQEQGNGD